MFVTQVQLRDFRNYERAEVSLGPGVTCFAGRNGQGKTNLVEAVGYMASGASHRVSTDAPLVRDQCDSAVVRTTVTKGERVVHLDATIARHGRNTFAANSQKLRSARALADYLVSVTFAPEDLALVKGDKGGRRGFVDGLLMVLSPKYRHVRTDYDRVVRQRNAVLKAWAGSMAECDMLAAYDDQLAGLGSDIRFARAYLINKVAPHVNAAYSQVSGRDDPATVTYPAGAGSERAQIRAEILAHTAERRAEEIARGVTVVGPHRDDVDILLRDAPAKTHASHGESWTMALALKFAAFTLLRDEGPGSVAERTPVLILDDVFAELDDDRRTRLAAVAHHAEQTLITVAAPADVPPDLGGATFTVNGGVISG